MSEASAASEAKTVKEVLIAARDILTNTGWCQGQYWRNSQGRFAAKREDIASACAVGSILQVDASQELRNKALDTIEGLTGIFLPTWNDDPKRTKEEVLQVFNKAIEEASDE